MEESDILSLKQQEEFKTIIHNTKKLNQARHN